MSKTILITGSSSGLGKASAKLFQARGWNVAATMRKPEKESELQQLENVQLFRLDVTNEESIEEAVAGTISAFGGIDVLLNNAGYGLAGPFEAATKAQIKRQYETNLFGMFDVTRAVLPHLRAKRDGVIINVTSIGGLVTMPFVSLYHGTKFAIEGWTESLTFELNPLNIRVKLVEPGGISTDFGGRSLDMAHNPDLADYQESLQQFIKIARGPERTANYSTAEQIAEVVYTAATDGTNRLRYVAGEDAKQMWDARKKMGDQAFIAMMKENFGLT